MEKAMTSVEKIQTGLTKNYVSYWTTKQAVKEAAQNISYGAVKSGEKPNIYYIDDMGFGVMEDFYNGFEKKHLYLGESEQRDDEDGLGNFGEGWKIFLLEMARKNLYHLVETVGFAFWGTMEETPHGTEVLVINVKETDRTKGTKVTFEVSKEDFFGAIESFALLSGIDEKYVKDDGIIPNRNGELWVMGVRIEQDDNTNPLELHFSYNLRNKKMVNRDRSQVDTLLAYYEIRNIIRNQPKEIVEEIIDLALKGSSKQDIIRGPFFFKENEIWLNAIAKAHGTTAERLALPTNNEAIDREAVYRGYTLIELPSQWLTELKWLGIKFTHELIKEKVKVDKYEPNEKEQQIIQQAMLDTKQALGLRSIHDFPPIFAAQSLRDETGVVIAGGMYDRNEEVIYISKEILSSQAKTTQVLIHETIHWKTGAADNTPEFTAGFEDAILNLLGYGSSRLTFNKPKDVEEVFGKIG